MSSKLRRTSIALFLLLAATVPLQAEEWGSLSGRFLYDGLAPCPANIVAAGVALQDESLEVAVGGGIKNVVVFLRTRGVGVAPSYAENAAADMVLDAKGSRFEPHVVLLRTTQSLVLKNSDPVAYNPKFDPLKNPPFNPLLPAGAQLKQSFAKEENLPIQVVCNIHPWMRGWVVVRETPYMAVSDNAGKFEIKDLPAGQELEFQLWQEKAGFSKIAEMKGHEVDRKGRFKITLQPGETKLGEIKVSPANFK